MIVKHLAVRHVARMSPETCCSCDLRRSAWDFIMLSHASTIGEVTMAARLSSLAPVTKLLTKQLAKHYSLDPVLTWLVKRFRDGSLRRH